MIEMIQYKPSSTELCGSINKLNEMSITMNKELILKDIDRLSNEIKTTNNKKNKENLKALVAYLKKILNNMQEDSTFELCWVTDTSIPYTYPLELIHEPLYGVNTRNYIEIESGEHLIEIDLKDLADLIAFEFMFKDLGETHESIEELLKDCGIISFEKATLLTDTFKNNGDDIFELSKTMLIEDCPYLSFEDKTISDYFHSKKFKGESYREVISYSCRYANTIIANSIVKNYLHKNQEIKLLAIDPTSITLVIAGDSEVNIDEISIRIFGRQFLIEPKVTIL